MSGTLVPALLAAGGGSVLLTGIAAHEYRRESRMRLSREAYALVFPTGVTAQAAQAALSTISGLDYRNELVAEVVATEDGVAHLLHIPASVAGSTGDQLIAALPGLRIDVVEARATGAVTAAMRITVAVGAAVRTDEVEAASRALLGGLGALREGERVSLRWALRPGGRAPEPNEPEAGKPMSSGARAELAAARARQNQPGFTVSGLLLVRAGTPARAGQLTNHVTAVLRSRRGAGRGLMLRRGSVRSGVVMPGTGRARGWLSAAEVVGLLGWPLGREDIAGVITGASRRIAVPRGLSRDGRPLLVGRDAYGDRPVALGSDAALHHVALVGASGTGKSSLMAAGILSDLERGFGGVLIDPKADLVSDVLARVPRHLTHRVVVLDPSTRGPVPGLNLLGVGDPDLRADVILGALGGIFADSWGVRTDTYLRLGLRTLGDLPSPVVLTDWIRLFTDSSFRRDAVARVQDPVAVMAWRSYEALSAAEQHQHVAAPMSKVMSLLSRPAVRSVLAQAHPKLDIGQLLAEGRWLLISLAPGTLGEPTARLLGSVLTYAVWTAIEGRAALPPERRRPAFFYVDELQSLEHLPFGMEYLFERARGLQCGVVVATQALGRLSASTRRSLLGNVGTLVSLRLGYEEAANMARELPNLEASDLQALGRFEVAARVSTGTGSATAVVTGRTEPPGPLTHQAERVRARSAERYGGVAADLGSMQGVGSSDEIAPDDEALGRRRTAQ